ncbi:hypothetical protein EJF18_40838 [Clavispora lusitaniae]|uniref:Uncharacterized protein n=1 Tax=Clavispora lusitaniae TaxID=36911 RepID=A0ACD0WN27_CLALS|nr:hypothetical protein EJF14_40838 [Clavispora lusitaniae]QFZ34447.1 hypothetical protein EJF16_40838 [Clavispora lusitaniae]QFZ34449.1 hypothetical protein EJF16_40839 [Clavispora lusitaniae]QFZ40131.1 hypothetical protein EJF15_40838 [Clavispora lusitaniae]QFZ40133.1 hypothetical protein EJF15_40853 [Clavispora lusitaniae]
MQKYRSRGQARGGKDKGFGEQKGKIQSCQARVSKNTTSDGQYRRYNTRLRPVRRLRPESTGARRPRSRSSLRSGEQKDCSTTISRIVSNCITRCGSKWLD